MIPHELRITVDGTDGPVRGDDFAQPSLGVVGESHMDGWLHEAEGLSAPLAVDLGPRVFCYQLGLGAAAERAVQGAPPLAIFDQVPPALLLRDADRHLRLPVELRAQPEIGQVRRVVARLPRWHLPHSHAWFDSTRDHPQGLRLRDRRHGSSTTSRIGPTRYRPRCASVNWSVFGGPSAPRTITGRIWRGPAH